MKMKTMKETIMKNMKNMKNKIKFATTMAGLAFMIYMGNPVVAQAKGLTMSGLKDKINKFVAAVMAIEVAIACGVFGAFSGKDLIVFLSGGDEQEKKAALKNVKSKVPALIAILLGAELVTLIAGYFVSSVTMPTPKM